MTTRTDTTTRLVYGLLVLLMAGLGLLLADGAELAERVVLIRRWCLAAAAVFAVAAPHVLLPDRHVATVQLLNLPPRALMGRQLRRWAPLVAVFALPVVLLAFYDPTGWNEVLGAKAIHALTGTLLVAGAGLYSLDRYSVIGPTSQAWQEGRAGQGVRQALEHAPAGARPPVPYGLFPAITATGRVFLVAALFVVASAAATRLAGAWALLPALLLTGYVGARLARRAPGFDRFFYHTDAFYSELFRQAGGVRGTEREPVPFSAVYWVPRPQRAYVWAALRQMDRRLPLGRLVVLGHLFVWLLFYQEAGAGVIGAVLLAFSAAKNAAVGLLATEALAPLRFQVTLQRPYGWFATRLLVNLRWSFPWLASLMLVAWASSSFTYAEALAWTGVDLTLAVLAAALATWRHERRYLRQFV